MHIRREGQERLTFSTAHLKITHAWYRKYEKMDSLLRDNPRILSLVHEDVKRVLSIASTGRRSSFTSDHLLRMILVMQIEGLPFRAVIIRVDDSPLLRQFVRIGEETLMSYALLQHAFKAIRPSTWEKINAALATYARDKKKIEGSTLRLDTTVYETNIHYPTDSSLLGDAYRVLARLLGQIRDLDPQAVGSGRFQTKKVKRLSLLIARKSAQKTKAPDALKTLYRQLLAKVHHLVHWARQVLHQILEKRRRHDYPFDRHLVLHGLSDEVDALLPLIEQVMDQARRRTQQGESVPNDEKLFSLFETHTELIQKGKVHKPIEFGHAVLLQQVVGKFITGYQVLEHNQPEADLLEDALQQHKKLFDVLPQKLTGDKAFFGSGDRYDALAKRIPHVSIAKRGARTEEETQREHSKIFRALQRFRAGIEGSISFLKRALKFTRCLYRSFPTYAASVGSIVFCHNLIVLARLL